MPLADDWKSERALVLATIERHEESIDAVLERLAESDRRLVETLALLRQEISDSIVRQERGIARLELAMESRFQAVAVDLARLGLASTWRASALGLAGGAIPAAVAVVYMLMRAGG